MVLIGRRPNRVAVDFSGPFDTTRGVRVLREGESMYPEEREYVRAELLEGAVAALREIRERTDVESPDVEMWEDVVLIVDRVLYPDHPGGQ